MQSSSFETITIQRLIDSAPHRREVTSDRAGSVNRSGSPLTKTHLCASPWIPGWICWLHSLLLQLDNHKYLYHNTSLALLPFGNDPVSAHRYIALHTAEGNMVISSLSPVKAPPPPTSRGWDRKERAQRQRLWKHQKGFDLTIAGTLLLNIMLIYVFLFK